MNLKQNDFYRQIFTFVKLSRDARTQKYAYVSTIFKKAKIYPVKFNFDINSLIIN